MILTAYRHGLRAAELCALRWDQVDFEREFGLKPTRLEAEVTESALVEDLDTARQVLEALRAAGTLIVMDDFGTGFSSLYHLRELRFDKLKIDRSFVQTRKRR